VAGSIRSHVASMNPNLPILTSQTLEEQLMSGPVSTQLRVGASVSAAVGLIGLLLAAVGVVGVDVIESARATDLPDLENLVGPPACCAAAINNIDKARADDDIELAHNNSPRAGFYIADCRRRSPVDFRHVYHVE